MEEHEQSLKWAALTLFLSLTPTVLFQVVKDAIYVLLGRKYWRNFPIKRYPDGCLQKTSRFALTYCSGSANAIIPPFLLHHQNAIISSSFKIFVAICQCISFFVRAFPYFSLGAFFVFIIPTLLLLSKNSSKIKKNLLIAYYFVVLVASSVLVAVAGFRCKEGYDIGVFTAHFLNTFFIFAGSLVGSIWGLINIYKNTGKIIECPMYCWTGILIYAASYFSGVISTWMKDILKDPRPSSFYPPDTIQCALSYGNPSEHTMTAFSWFFIIVMEKRHKVIMEVMRYRDLVNEIHQKSQKDAAAVGVEVTAVPPPPILPPRPQTKFWSAALVACSVVMLILVPVSRYALGYHTFIQLFFGVLGGTAIVWIFSMIDWIVESADELWQRRKLKLKENKAKKSLKDAGIIEDKQKVNKKDVMRRKSSSKVKGNKEKEQ